MLLIQLITVYPKMYHPTMAVSFGRQLSKCDTILRVNVNNLSIIYHIILIHLKMLPFIFHVAFDLPESSLYIKNAI